MTARSVRLCLDIEVFRRQQSQSKRCLYVCPERRPRRAIWIIVDAAFRKLGPYFPASVTVAARNKSWQTCTDLDVGISPSHMRWRQERAMPRTAPFCHPHMSSCTGNIQRLPSSLDSLIFLLNVSISLFLLPASSARHIELSPELDEWNRELLDLIVFLCSYLIHVVYVHLNFCSILFLTCSEKVFDIPSFFTYHKSHKCVHPVTFFL